MANVFQRILEITAVSTAMILAVFVFRAMLAKRIRPGVIGALWALVLLRLCLPVMLESPVHVPQFIPQQQETAAGQTEDTNVTDPAYAAIDYQPGSEYVPEAVHAPETEYESTSQVNAANESAPAQQPAVSSPKVDWLAIASYVWIAGVAAVLLSAVWRGASFGRSVKRCGVCKKAVRIADEIRPALKIKRIVPVRICGGITTPVLFGLLRPQILLPENCGSADNEALRCILAHELCHVKRHDILKGYIWLIAKAAHWFNPFVWLAYGACKDDIELCCDDMVLRLIGTDNRFMYTQSLIDVFRSYRHALPAAAPLFESKPKLTERVMRMLKPNKRSKAAAALSVLLVLIMLVAGFTTACSPAVKTTETTNTPEQTEVVQPTTTHQESTPAPSQEAAIEPEKKPLAEYKTVGHWTDSFEKEKSLIKINADADIVMPEVNTFKTYKVNPNGYISQEMADKMIDVFFGDTPVYKYNYPTKEGLQKELDDLLDIRQSMQDGTFDFSDYSDKQGIIDGTEKEIDSLKDRIKDAPEAPEPVLLDTTLVPNGDGGGSFQGVADLGRDEQARIRLYNSSGYTEVRFINEGNYFDRELSADQIGNLTISADDAKKTAEALLAELGLDNYQLCSNYIAGRFKNFCYVDTGKYAHVLTYTRVVDGVVVSPNGPIPMIDSMDYNHEEIRIAIDNDGIREFDWRSKFDIDETEQTYVTLLPMDDIEKAVADQMFILYRNMPKILDEGTGIPKVKTQGYTLNIKEVRLEYAKMPCEGDIKNNRLIPVWNVYATTDWRYSVKENGKLVTKSDNSINKRPYVVLTLSAIDGSMLDFSLAANKGYCP